MPRRKAGAIVPLEAEILDRALALRRNGGDEFHGFGIAQTMRDADGSRSLTGHGTLYKALGRLEQLGLLESRWEDPATVQGRPARRLYRLTAAGMAAAAAAAVAGAPSLDPIVAGLPS